MTAIPAPLLPDAWYETLTRQLAAAVGMPGGPGQLAARLPVAVWYCRAWQHQEASRAAGNPFDTTWWMPGATPYNTFHAGSGTGGAFLHVWDYATDADGVTATVRTLLARSDYHPIIDALLSGSALAFGHAVDTSPWGTTGVAAYLLAHPYPAPDPQPPSTGGPDVTPEELVATLDSLAQKTVGIETFAGLLTDVVNLSRASFNLLNTIANKQAADETTETTEAATDATAEAGEATTAPSPPVASPPGVTQL